jgi:hypothetical protein
MRISCFFWNREREEKRSWPPLCPGGFQYFVAVILLKRGLGDREGYPFQLLNDRKDRRDI